MEEPYMSAREAAAALGVSRATLYAYVSRGLIRSESLPGKPRRRRYHASDVARLIERKEQRSNPALAAQHALHFGDPVLTSAITLIDGGRFFYRGEDAVNLATSRRVEEVASFLWSGQWEPIKLQEATIENVISGPFPETLTTLERFQCVLPLAAAGDFAAYDLQPSTVRAIGARILHLFTVAAAGMPLEDDMISTLEQGWNIRLPGAHRLLSAALILCADHELNVSSFTARCVASAGSTPYQVVQAGLAALQGVKHGGYTARVTALLEEVGEAEHAHAVLGERLRRGESIPGFGHPLYPNGDPRAQALLEMMKVCAPDRLALAQAIVEDVQRLLGLRPTIDFALAVLARFLSLARDGGLTLFALGRTIGWIGHALEQYQAGDIIRPRARYEGPLPDNINEDTVLP